MIAFAEAGDPVLLIAKVPAEFSDAAHDLERFAIPVMSRNNGLDCLSGDDVLHVIGPSKGIPVQLHEEGDDQTAVPVPGNVNVLLVDLSDDALVWLREHDQNVDVTESIAPFSVAHPFAVPVASQLEMSQLVPLYSSIELHRASVRILFTAP